MENQEKKQERKIVVRRITSWKDVLNAARFTQRKEPLDKEPSNAFKLRIVKAEHSPLRALIYTIDFYNIPYYVTVHLCRHVHAQPFVSTSRPDIDGTMKPREEQKKTDPVNMRLLVNAQEIINISRVRLCNKAEKETHLWWREAMRVLMRIDPLLTRACAPNCIYRGFCPEMKSCGYASGKLFKLCRETYVNVLNK